MSEVLNRTRSYCRKCSAFHEAVYRQEGADVFFDVECPAGAFRHHVSDDAGLFKKIRALGRFDACGPYTPPPRSPKRFTIVNITNRCNFTCAICYAAANVEQDAWELSPEDVFRSVEQIKKEGRSIITLSGGEPSIHPRVLEIIAGIRKRGLFVNMSTNGYRIATEPGFAEKLKKAGLGMVTLSFDSLQEDINRLYRKNSFLPEKKRALENARAAGLRMTCLVTVSTYNVSETGAIIRYLAGFAPSLSYVFLQPYFCTVNPGDSNAAFDSTKIVKRERIVKELVASRAVEGLTEDHFFPFPQAFITVHPDCAAVGTLAFIRGRVVPLDDLMDMHKYNSRISRYGGELPLPLLPLHELKTVLECARPGKRLQTLKCFYGFFTGRGDHSLVVTIAEGFMDSAYQDEERALRCTSQVWLKEGRLDHLGCMCSYGMQQ